MSHFHIWKPAIDQRTGQINMLQRIRRTFRTRQAASQFVGRKYNWFLNDDGRTVRIVLKCDDLYCQGRDAKGQAAAA